MNIVINTIINKWNLKKGQPIDLNQLKLNLIHDIENEIKKMKYKLFHFFCNNLLLVE